MSDHFSGPRGLLDPACDICDVFAFPSPGRPEHLVLAMTIFPLAGPTAVFSDAVQVRFRSRPVTIERSESPGRFLVGADSEEITFDLTFDEPVWQSGNNPPTQVGRCTTPAGGTVSFTVGDRNGGHGPGINVFAGLASDPFIFDESVIETIRTGRMAFKDVGVNALLGANVLGVVVELERAHWLGAGPLFAVVTETLSVGKKPVRLERVGRPEVKNISMQSNAYDTVNRDIDLRDLYNEEDAFAIANNYIGAYRARLNANLSFFDGLDGKVDWPIDQNGNHPLTDLWLEDFLVVDVSKPFVENGYFEIEQAMLDGLEHQTCGGRSLNEDFLDTLYTLMINGGNGPRIRDGLDHATVPAANVFPYLAPPNPPQQQRLR